MEKIKGAKAVGSVTIAGVIYGPGSTLPDLIAHDFNYLVEHGAAELPKAEEAAIEVAKAGEEVTPTPPEPAEVDETKEVARSRPRGK